MPTAPLTTYARSLKTQKKDRKFSNNIGNYNAVSSPKFVHIHAKLYRKIKLTCNINMFCQTFLACCADSLQLILATSKLGKTGKIQ